MIMRHICSFLLTASSRRFVFRAAGRGSILALAILGLAACADQSLGQPDAMDERAEIAASATGSPVSHSRQPQLVAEEIGIAVQGVHLSSAGYVLDMRFRVLDVEKAAAMLSRQAKPYAVVEKSGIKLGVPVSYKLGPLRQSTTHPEDERIYFTFFTNPGRHVKSGDVIRLVVGEYTTEPITVL